MRILFTGASSFTGGWFVSGLAAAGHDVHATFTRSNVEAYGDDVRGQRVRQIIEKCQPMFGCRFGDVAFINLLRQQQFDILCHHAADVTNYKSADFDVSAAVSNNTHRMIEVIKVLVEKPNAAMLLTGSVFETGEGAGSDGLPPLSPYGLSKALTSQICQNYCQTIGARMGKFVIPNPFGPWEEFRFTAYLMRCWSAGEAAAIQTPVYVRDNIHVSLLAAAYVAFAASLSRRDRFCRTNPSGYVESQGAFAERLAREMRARTGWKCDIDLATQKDFKEPAVRVNTDPVDAATLGWDESAAWDEFARYYEGRLAVV